MYFAFDNCNPAALCEQLISTIRTSNPDAKWYALVDLAFDHERRNQLRWKYARTPLYRKSGLESISPTLLAVRTPSETATEKDLLNLLQHCKGRPMLSFVCAAREQTGLADEWQNIVKVQTQDEQPFLLRFADTRVCMTLQRSLHITTWRRVCQPISDWYVIDRSGMWLALHVTDQVKESDVLVPPVEPGPFSIDTEELSRLLHASQPDMLIDFMADHVPEILPSQNKAALYEWVAQACLLSNQYGLERLDDQLAMATATCISDGELLKNPNLVKLLTERRWHDGALGDALIDLLPTNEQAFT